MKRRTAALILALALCLGAAALAADGEVLVSLSHLKGAFTSGFLETLQGSGDSLYQEAERQAEALAGQPGGQSAVRLT